MAFENIPSPPKFSFTVAEINAKAISLVQQTKAGINNIISSVNPQNATFDNVLVPIAHIENELSYDMETIALLESVSPAAEIRKAASDAIQNTREAWDAIYENEPLFHLIESVKQQDPRHLDEESRRLLTDLHSGCVERGIELTGALRERFSEITRRKSVLRSAFVANLATSPGFVVKSDSELEGLSKSKLESFAVDEQGKRRVPLHRANVNAILRKCTNSQTRRDVWVAGESKYPDNAAYFREAVLLRDEAARMLGCRSFHHQLVRNRMMKSPEAVMTLLETVGTKIKPLVEAEMATLRELSGGETIHFWDLAYYGTLMLLERNLDSELVAEYFPADFVLERMLEIFERLFHLDIEEIADRAVHEVWHPDVKMYKVREVEGPFVGYLYMDLYPREGKYNHAADFSVRPVSPLEP
jgi:metallopeptidase MepB